MFLFKKLKLIVKILNFDKRIKNYCDYLLDFRRAIYIHNAKFID